MDLIVNNKVVPAINQIETHPFYQRIEDQQFLSENSVQIESWAPFAEGKNEIFSNEILASIGSKNNKSIAQVILRWLIQRGVVVIPKSVKKERITENFIYEQGITFFDTAEAYGPFANEELLGEALAPFRNEVVIATKFGFKDGMPDLGMVSRPETIKAVAEAAIIYMDVSIKSQPYHIQPDDTKLYYSTAPCFHELTETRFLAPLLYKIDTLKLFTVTYTTVNSIG